MASATKMCRSVIIKGMEAMMIESLVTARHHGVEDSVLASLAETFPTTRTQFNAFIAAESAKYADVIKRAKASLD